jgi:hypothetical protein
LTAGQEELKTDINAVKTDINVVTAGQEELKNNMKSEISAVNNDIENRITCEISSSHGGAYDVQSCLLGYTEL